MALLHSFLRLTDYKSPFLRTLVPSVTAAYAIQAAFAVPSVIGQTERFYDFSGALTFLSVTAVSLYLPSLRVKAAASLAGSASKVPLPSLLAPFLNAGGNAGLNWRQVALSAAVSFWAIRLGSYLFARILQTGHDSRFEKIKKSPTSFSIAWFAQATWVSLSLMPVIAINSIPPAVFTKLPGLKVTDALGMALYLGGLTFEVVADNQKSQWLKEKQQKQHDEEFMTRGLWSRSQFPNYFGESTLWTGVATVAAGVLITSPVQLGLGFGGISGQITALGLSYVSPAFVTFLLTRISGIPLSERKYNKRYGDRKDYQEWKKNTPKFFPKLF